MYTNENYSERTLTVLNIAREEARMLGHNFIGSEMLLLGLLSQNILPNLSLDAARGEVFQLIGRGPGYVSSQPPYTPNANRVLERAIILAFEHLVEPEHLLLALTEEGDLAIRVLENLGVSIPELREQIQAQLQSLSSQQPDSPQQTTEAENQSSERPILLPSVRLVNRLTRSNVSPPKRINLTVLPQESGRYVCEAHASGNLSSGVDFTSLAYGDTEFLAIAEALESLARSYRDFRVQS